MPEPHVSVRVDRRIWDAVASAVRPSFANNYLGRAIQAGQSITPNTVIAYEALTRNPDAFDALRKLGVGIIKPLHFGHPDRPDTI